MKIGIDYTKCTALGICEAFAPEVFEVNEEGLAVNVETVPDDMLDMVRQAVEGCPTAALRLHP